MNEKRFSLEYYDNMPYVKDNFNDNEYYLYWAVELMNELYEENEDLREVNKENQLLHEENVKQCERWRTLYELKDAEVTARVDGLNKVCEYYLTEAQFKAETDPNQAVQEVINAILNTEVEM